MIGREVEYKTLGGAEGRQWRVNVIKIKCINICNYQQINKICYLENKNDNDSEKHKTEH